MKDYIPYVNRFADLPTILEAYQYLMRRYVTNARERKRKWLKAKNTSGAISAFKKARELRFTLEPEFQNTGYHFSECFKLSYRFYLHPKMIFRFYYVQFLKET